MNNQSNKSTKSTMIERTVFNFEHFDTQEYFDSVKREKYIRHNINVSNRLIIKGCALDAMYQTGNSFRNNDYTLPCEVLKISRYDRTDELLVKVSELEEFDLQTDQDIDNIIDYLNSPLVENKQDLIDLYEALKSNLRDARNYFKALDFETAK